MLLRIRRFEIVLVHSQPFVQSSRVHRQSAGKRYVKPPGFDEGSIMHRQREGECRIRRKRSSSYGSLRSLISLQAAQSELKIIALGEAGQGWMIDIGAEDAGQNKGDLCVLCGLGDDLAKEGTIDMA